MERPQVNAVDGSASVLGGRTALHVRNEQVANAAQVGLRLPLGSYGTNGGVCTLDLGIALVRSPPTTRRHSYSSTVVDVAHKT